MLWKIVNEKKSFDVSVTTIRCGRVIMVICTIDKTVLFLFLSFYLLFFLYIYMFFCYYIYTIRTFGYLHIILRQHSCDYYTFVDAETQKQSNMYNGASTLFFAAISVRSNSSVKKNETSIFFFR